MIISNKQILQLMRIAEAYCSAMHRFGEYKIVDNVQDILATINDQQSEELKSYSGRDKEPQLPVNYSDHPRLASCCSVHAGTEQECTP